MDSIATPPRPLQTIIPSYVYQQYADDPNIVAFANAYNIIAQAYLDWFNQTPFGVYTSPNVSGPLLDWIGKGIYGIPRPVFSNLRTHFVSSAVNNVPLNSIALNGSRFFETGSATTATDDFYKRVITWFTYIGDGRYFNMINLRKRIARFLYGVNGGDISLAQAQNVSITLSTSTNFHITIPSAANPASSYFQEGFESGIFSFPFQLTGTVVIV